MKRSASGGNASRSERRGNLPVLARASAAALMSLANKSTSSSHRRSARIVARENISSPVAQAADQTRGRAPISIAGAMKSSTATCSWRRSRKK
jgi:hypothetical protein